MATNDVNLQVINSMTEEQMNSLKDANGKIPSLVNQIIMTDDENSENYYKAGNGISIDNGVISSNSTVVKICDSSGSNAGKALSDSLSNYKLVGIYARWNNAQRFGTVMPVELFKTTAVSNTLTIANGTVYLNCYYSNDTTITVQNSYGNISNFYVYGIK